MKSPKTNGDVDPAENTPAGMVTANARAIEGNYRFSFGSAARESVG